MTEQYRVGDRVQLASMPLGRGKRLRVGLVGEVVATGLELGWVSVLFPVTVSPYPFRLRPAHLRRVAVGVPV
jgi:hypothetical protein